MKKFFLTTIAVLTILFAQGQCQAYFGLGQNGTTISFTDSSTMQSTNYSATWSWDFGDGNTSTQQNPIHTYSNGMYNACLIVTFLDSTIMNYCTSTYCDSILIGNAPPASWDCTPATGCYDPGTGNGQYTTLAACQTACGVTPSWDCISGVAGWSCFDPGTGLGQYSSFIHCDTTCGANAPSWDCDPVSGCFDPGTGFGQYTTLTACQTACASTVSYDCDPINGCYDPGTGNGQYSTLSACQSVCSSISPSLCDSMTATGSQNQIQMGVNNFNNIIYHWYTTDGNGNFLAEDSMSNTHNLNVTALNDTIITCITYPDGSSSSTCCVIWIWNGISWANTGGTTSIDEINFSNRALLKVVDLLGRDANGSTNEPLFYIYDDGTVEKKIILE